MAMKRVGIAELKDRLSEHLRAVEGGAEVVVLDRKRPIARIVPVSRSVASSRIVPPSRAFATIRDRRRAPARWPTSSTVLLMEERRER
jgi:antitoxin (DNA-binding transcriptional repressor) of toxin-antitoxin stability system